MEEFVITKKMRNHINSFLGYELIKKNEVGHHLYDEAPGLGKIGIEGVELKEVVTNKQLDAGGNIEWHKNPNPLSRDRRVRAFRCRLTTVSAKKAKILIASLFPEETFQDDFFDENKKAIAKLRRELEALKNKREMKENYGYSERQEKNFWHEPPIQRGILHLYDMEEEERIYMLPFIF